MERPPIIGVPGVTYFKVHETAPFHIAYPDMEVFLDGKNVHACSNEVDMEGGWVCVLWEKFQGQKRESVWGKEIVEWTDPDTGVTSVREMDVAHWRPYTRRYIRGVITLKRQSCHPAKADGFHPVKFQPSDGCKFTIHGTDYSVNLNTIRIQEMRDEFREKLDGGYRNQIIGEITAKFSR